MHDDSLQSSLVKLKIDVGKLQIWLTYRGLKPMSSIIISEHGNKELFAWLKKYGLKHMISGKFPTTLHISKNQDTLDQNRKLEMSDTPYANKIRGLLYGFPEKAVDIYSQNLSHLDEFLVHARNSDVMKGLHWTPYVEYLVRKNHELEDSKIAKQWADSARKEIPQIAKEYEKQNLLQLIR